MGKVLTILIAVLFVSIFGCSGTKEISNEDEPYVKAKKEIASEPISLGSSKSEKIIKEGIAYLGNGITVEDAQNVAVNDARQKALNSLGAFFESQKVVKNGRLTKSELSSMTGAIMKSKVLKSKKEVQGEVFVLKLKIEFVVDMASFDKALQKYQEESTDKKTIQQLMFSLQKMQSLLLKQTASKEANFEALEIADEIVFINKRMGKLLSAGEKIQTEADIRKHYEQSLTKKIHMFTRLYMKTISLYLEFENVPFKGEYFALSEDSINMIISSGFSKFKNNKNTRLSSDLRQLEYNKMMRAAKAIQDTIQTYNKMKLRIAPKISVSWKFSRSFSMYINGIQYGYNLKNNLKKFKTELYNV